MFVSLEEQPGGWCSWTERVKGRMVEGKIRETMGLQGGFHAEVSPIGL